jgi:Holliday junction DNA helicase RuvA
MYAYIKGKLLACTPVYTIVETGGIGYKIHIPSSLFGTLPSIGEETVLHTSFIVRELAHTLYGFMTAQERDLFEVLLTVTGIGPKTALSLIGHLTPAELNKAIQAGNIASISRVPGIGKKTSERLIMEMKDKLPSFLSKEFPDFATTTLTDPQALKIQDAMSALINLGYNQSTAQKAIKNVINDRGESIGLSELITFALKHV